MGIDLRNQPIRVFKTPFAGDTWARAGVQVGYPDEIISLVTTDARIEIRIVAYDANGAPISETTATTDLVVAKITRERDGPLVLTRGTTLVERHGGEQTLGNKGFEEKGLGIGDHFVIGLPTFTAGDAVIVKIFVPSGAKLVGPSY